ncbi:MAG TPA: hypothetical protein PKD55_00930 [Bellilinea sp.]|nr:hypothetical protein [Bellilinea sp.]
MTLYNFKDELRHGQDGEARLDKFFEGLGFAIQPANRDEERQGIDRWFTNGEGDRRSVQYKTDFMSQDTGNLAAEIISVDRPLAAGWAFTTTAAWIAYYRYVVGDILWIPTAAMQARLADWIVTYKCKPTQNKRYRTINVYPPVAEWEAIAVAKWRAEVTLD